MSSACLPTLSGMMSGPCVCLRDATNQVVCSSSSREVVGYKSIPSVRQECNARA